jgi:hypothetical protein
MLYTYLALCRRAARGEESRSELQCHLKEFPARGDTRRDHMIHVTLPAYAVLVLCALSCSESKLACPPVPATDINRLKIAEAFKSPSTIVCAAPSSTLSGHTNIRAKGDLLKDTTIS